MRIRKASKYRKVVYFHAISHKWLLRFFNRWIFTCCFSIAVVWIAWTVVSTQILHQYRDLTISVANLVCATVVMLCMYLRKVYIYNKLTRDQENKAKLKQSVSVPPIPNMYGTLSRNTPNITPVTAYNSGKIFNPRFHLLL